MSERVRPSWVGSGSRAAVPHYRYAPACAHAIQANASSQWPARSVTKPKSTQDLHAIITAPLLTFPMLLARSHAHLLTLIAHVSIFTASICTYYLIIYHPVVVPAIAAPLPVLALDVVINNEATHFLAISSSVAACGMSAMAMVPCGDDTDWCHVLDNFNLLLCSSSCSPNAMANRSVWRRLDLYLSHAHRTFTV